MIGSRDCGEEEGTGRLKMVRTGEGAGMEGRKVGRGRRGRTMVGSKEGMRLICRAGSSRTQSMDGGGGLEWLEGVMMNSEKMVVDRMTEEEGRVEHDEEQRCKWEIGSGRWRIKK